MNSWLDNTLEATTTALLKNNLPALTEAQYAHLVKVLESTHSLVSRNNNWLSFEQYMQHVLYEPGIGYYSAGAQKLGPAGDFITAPEISSTFGYLLANQIAQVMALCSANHIVEFGAGSGKLASDILSRLDALGALPEKYFIVEVSADFIERQHAAIQKLPEHIKQCVEWQQALPKVASAIVLANEVVDALPVERVKLKNDELYAEGVSICETGFKWSLSDKAVEIPKHCTPFAGAWDNGYKTEIRGQDHAWTTSILDTFESGAAFLIDYGYDSADYYSPDRADGTLMCYFRHHKHSDPFLLPGLQDITASANFSLLAHAAETAHAKIGGYTTQANFLIGCGLDEALSKIPTEDSVAYLQQVQAIKQLMMPGSMGEQFKVLALTKGITEPLIGFSSKDLRSRL